MSERSGELLAGALRVGCRAQRATVAGAASRAEVTTAPYRVADDVHQPVELGIGR